MPGALERACSSYAGAGFWTASAISGPGLLFLQRLRDAAHRFALSRLRRNRRKAVLDSRLAGLKGIGPKTAKLLWENFPDVAAMRRASVRDLAALPGIGAKRAVWLHEVLQGIGAG